MPKNINKIPEITDHILSGKFPNPCNFCPKKFPIFKKKSWKMLTKKGKRIKLTCIKLPPIPMQKLSKESAIAKKIASLESLECDLSKSVEIGFLIIFIVIPKKRLI